MVSKMPSWTQVDELSKMIGEWDTKVPASEEATALLTILSEMRKRIIMLENPSNDIPAPSSHEHIWTSLVPSNTRLNKQYQESPGVWWCFHPDCEAIRRYDKILNFLEPIPAPSSGGESSEQCFCPADLSVWDVSCPKHGTSRLIPPSPVSHDEARLAADSSTQGRDYRTLTRYIDQQEAN